MPLVGRCGLLRTLNLKNMGQVPEESVLLLNMEAFLPSCPSLQRLFVGRAHRGLESLQLRSQTLQFLEVEHTYLTDMPVCDLEHFGGALREVKINRLCLSQEVFDRMTNHDVHVFETLPAQIAGWRARIRIDAVQLRCLDSKDEAIFSTRVLQALSALERSVGSSVHTLLLARARCLHSSTLTQLMRLLPNVREVRVACKKGEGFAPGFFETLLVNGFSTLEKLTVLVSPDTVDLVLHICALAQADKQRVTSLRVVVPDDRTVYAHAQLKWKSMMRDIPKPQRVFIE